MDFEGALRIVLRYRSIGQRHIVRSNRWNASKHRDGMTKYTRNFHNIFWCYLAFRMVGKFIGIKTVYKTTGSPIVVCVIKSWYEILLKTELRILDSQHFHWLARHKLSAHIPRATNMVNERVSKWSIKRKLSKIFSRNRQPLVKSSQRNFKTSRNCNTGTEIQTRTTKDQICAGFFFKQFPCSSEKSL